MTRDEDVHVDRDKRANIRPDERWKGSGRGPALWHAQEPVNLLNFHDSDRSIDGRFPQGFLRWVEPILGGNPAKWLHVCSGGLSSADVAGTRVDIRLEVRPDVVADGRALPFADDSFEAALIDPPYSHQHAADLYDTEYPRPSALLREASRVVRPCGRIGILHFLVCSVPLGCRFWRVWGITQGVGYRIRAFTVYERNQVSLF